MQTFFLLGLMAGAYSQDRPSGAPYVQDAPPTATESGASDVLSGVQVGYDNGFVIAGDEIAGTDAIDLPYLLRVNGWGQLRGTNFLADGGGEDLNQFQLKRAILVLSGHAFTPDFSYRIQMDGRSTSGDSVRLLDYYLTFDLGHHWWGADRNFFTMKTGKYKIPFTMARLVSGKEFQFTDRSMASTYFDVNRSLASGFYGELRPGGQLLTWETAIFNGLVTGGAETGSAGDLDNNYAYATRLAYFPVGEWGEDDLCDYDFHTTPAIRIGAAVATSRIDRAGTTEFDALRTVDSGVELSSLLPVATSEYLVMLYCVDASLKYRGLSLTSEYYFRNVNGFVGIDQSDLFDHGFWLQAGYFVIPQTIEFLARWSMVVGESGTLGAIQQSSTERAIGAVWYSRRHNAKLTIDGTWLDGAPIDSPSLDIHPGDRGFLARTQIQFAF